MWEYRFSLARILPYKCKIVDFILIRENTGQWNAYFMQWIVSNNHRKNSTYLMVLFLTVTDSSRHELKDSRCWVKQVNQSTVLWIWSLLKNLECVPRVSAQVSVFLCNDKTIQLDEVGYNCGRFIVLIFL